MYRCEYSTIRLAAPPYSHELEDYDLGFWERSKRMSLGIVEVLSAYCALLEPVTLICMKWCQVQIIRRIYSVTGHLFGDKERSCTVQTNNAPYQSPVSHWNPSCLSFIIDFKL